MSSITIGKFVYKKYIDKAELLDALARLKERWGNTFTAEGVGEAIEKVKQAYTADVVEVRHGFWTAHPASYECSICGNEFFVEGYAEDYDAVEDYDLHYCPNCGAKMDGERKEQE